MVPPQPLSDSDQQEEQKPRGLLFRISIRAGALVFVAVLAAGVWSNLEAEAALLRALLALVALSCCGWLAEQVAQSQWWSPSVRTADGSGTGVPAAIVRDDA